MPITTTLKPTSDKHHPFNLTYVFLWLRVALLRYMGNRMQRLGIKRQLKTIPDNVVRSVIKIPSREGGRTIEAHVYEPKEGTKKPLAVHVNFHGFVIAFSCFREVELRMRWL